jgi:hypothetical protein
LTSYSPGGGVTTNTLAQRVCALRKRALAITGTNSQSVSNAANPDGTPKKRIGRPPKAKTEGGGGSGSSATSTPSKKPRKNKIIRNEHILISEEDGDDMDDVTDNFKTDGPTTPPQTPRKLAEPCTPSRASSTHNKVKHGRVEKNQQSRVSPRKRNIVTSYANNNNGEIEELKEFLRSDDEIDGVEGTASEHAFGVVLGEQNEMYYDDDEEEDEYVPEEL